MLAIIAVVVAACGPTPTPPASIAALATPAATPAATTPIPTGATPPIATQPVATPGPTASVVPALKVTALRLQLPMAVSRAVAFADGDAVLLAGGLTPSGTTAVVLRIDIVAGTVTINGKLAQAVHDAGGALVAGAPTIFGGGNVVPESVVQRFDGGLGAVVGQLPRARADLVVVDDGATAFVIGGGTPVAASDEAATTMQFKLWLKG